MKPCSVTGCPNPVRATGYCRKHYMLRYHTGQTSNKVLRGGTALERFGFWVEKTDSCWIWKGVLDKGGYGRIKDDSGWRDMAHRWSYRHFVGEIPEGLIIDHLCKNPACVNPSHLEPVTYWQNSIERGVTNVGFVNSEKTHCIRGHSLEDAYVSRSKYGIRRSCKECQRIRTRAYKLKIGL